MLSEVFVITKVLGAVGYKSIYFYASRFGDVNLLNLIWLFE